MRRDPKKFIYNNILCENPECSDLNCEFSHNEFELNYHPIFYKTIPCTFNPCCWQNACPFLHPSECREIEEKLIQKELNEFKDKFEMLEEMIKIEKKNNDEMDAFICSICNVEISCIALNCGHLVCKECVPEIECRICRNPSNPIIVLCEIQE